MPSRYDNPSSSYEGQEGPDALFYAMSGKVQEWRERNADLLTQTQTLRRAGDAAGVAVLRAQLERLYADQHDNVFSSLKYMQEEARKELGLGFRQDIDGMHQRLSDLAAAVLAPLAEPGSFEQVSRQIHHQAAHIQVFEGLKDTARGLSPQRRTELAFALAFDVAELGASYNQARTNGRSPNLPPHSGGFYSHNGEVRLILTRDFAEAFGLSERNADVLGGFMNAGLATLPPEQIAASRQ